MNFLHSTSRSEIEGAFAGDEVIPGRLVVLSERSGKSARRREGSLKRIICHLRK